MAEPMLPVFFLRAKTKGYYEGWNTVLRLYGPLESWFDKTWRPGEIELVQ
jgi:hypothetical protein